MGCSEWAVSVMKIIQTSNRNWSRAVSMISARSMPLSPPPVPPKTTLVFLRLDSAAVFLPVHLTPPTLSQLKTQLREKFSSLADAKVCANQLTIISVTTSCFSLAL